MRRATRDITKSLESISDDNLYEVMIGQIMETHKHELQRYAKYARFSKQAYCRTKMFTCPGFEIIVIGWLPGQFTLIHDHASLCGAVMVMAGSVTEELFRINTNGYASVYEAAKYLHGSISTVGAKTVHRIGNPGIHKAVTLHIYAPPMGEMKIYHEEAIANE